jgi:hypothetical protein
LTFLLVCLSERSFCHDTCRQLNKKVEIKNGVCIDPSHARHVFVSELSITYFLHRKIPCLSFRIKKRIIRFHSDTVAVPKEDSVDHQISFRHRSSTKGGLCSVVLVQQAESGSAAVAEDTIVARDCCGPSHRSSRRRAVMQLSACSPPLCSAPSS